MLILNRQCGEAIVISGEITVRVLAIDGDRVKLGIEAPPDIPVLREELFEGVTGENRRAADRRAAIAQRLRSRQPRHRPEAEAADDDAAPSV